MLLEKTNLLFLHTPQENALYATGGGTLSFSLTMKRSDDICVNVLQKKPKKNSLRAKAKVSDIDRYLEDVKKFHKKVDKPTWKEYFISMAKLASTRSSDSQTKHGCVITDKENRVLGIGYNSFPKGMPDETLPNIRPYKYKWMVHAERNALANCTHRPEGGTAYITGPPCLDCAKALYQDGVKNFICIDGHGTHDMDDEDKTIFDILVKEGGIKIEWIKKCQN